MAGKDLHQVHLKMLYQHLPGEAEKTRKSDVRTTGNAAEIEPDAFRT
jgi:hypothetical protein